MKRTGCCPKCTGHDVLFVEVTDQVEDALVGLAQDAYVCATCGYIEFYARDPVALRGVAKVVRAGTGEPFR